MATILLLSTAACGTTVSNPACPALVAYAPADLDRAAQEMATLPRGAELRTMMEDYHTARDQIRACRGEQPWRT